MESKEKSSLLEIKQEKSWDEICEQVGKPRFVADKGVWGLSRTEQDNHRRSTD